jgi:hypothetical protein
MVSTICSDLVSVGDNNTCSCNLLDDSAPASPMSRLSFVADDCNINVFSFSAPLVTKTLTLSSGYNSHDDIDDIDDIDILSDIPIHPRRISNEEYSLSESSGSVCESSICSGTCSSKITDRTRESNPAETTLHEIPSSQITSITASRLRYLEYLEKHLSSIVERALEDITIE